MKPWFVPSPIGWAMVFSTHLILIAFQGLHFKRQGTSPGPIGLLTRLLAFSQAAMFFLSRRLASGCSASTLMLVSAVMSEARWVAMSLSPGAGVFVGMQMMHSVTSAISLLGRMGCVANWTSEDIAAEAQSFFMMPQQGVSVLATMVFGQLATDLGARASSVRPRLLRLGGRADLDLAPAATAKAPASSICPLRGQVWPR